MTDTPTGATASETTLNPFAIDADTLTGMKPIRQVVYSLGSNLGDSISILAGAVNALRDTPDVKVVDVSSVYETDPVDTPEGTPHFYNIVVVADTTQDTQTLLERAMALEDAYDREREGYHAPRTLDVDLVMVGQERRDTPELTLPHPEAHHRAFVLVPWLEIDPKAALPGHGRIDALVDGLDVSGVRRRDDIQLED